MLSNVIIDIKIISLFYKKKLTKLILKNLPKYSLKYLFDHRLTFRKKIIVRNDDSKMISDNFEALEETVSKKDTPKAVVKKKETPKPKSVLFDSDSDDDLFKPKTSKLGKFVC